MLIWQTFFRADPVIPSLPRIQQVTSERQDSPDYHHEGRFRKSEFNCIYKYTLRGEGVFRDASGEHRLPAGTGFLCEIGDPDTAYYYPVGGKETWEFVYVSFMGESVFPMVRDLLKRYGPIYRFSLDDELPKRMLQARHREPAVTREVSPGDNAAQAMAVLGLLADSGARQEPPDGVLLIRRVRGLLREAKDENLNVSQIAAELRVSREHLSRTFKAQTGETPYSYILRERMHRACHLLKETNLSCKEVAAQLGFDAPGHFTRSFRKVIGMPPRRFREVGSIPFG